MIINAPKDFITKGKKYNMSKFKMKKYLKKLTKTKIKSVNNTETKTDDLKKKENMQLTKFRKRKIKFQRIKK